MERGEVEKIATDVVDVSMKLHMALGPGLLESVYTVMSAKKLEDRGYRVEREKVVPVELDLSLIHISEPTRPY